MVCSQPLWSSPVDLRLSSEVAHVWRGSLDLPPARVETLRLYLAADELQRAERFHFEHHRRRYIVAHGVLRLILSRYLNIHPGEVTYQNNRYGKPALFPKVHPEPLEFNLSHSNGLALYGITLGRKIGIDLELIRQETANEEIAERFFSPDEVRVLRSLSAELQAEAFFNCWARKEAFIKALGKGLSVPLDSFEVSLAPGLPAKLLRTKDNPDEASRWSLTELHPGLPYVAAVAVEGHDVGLECWQSEDDARAWDGRRIATLSPAPAGFIEAMQNGDNTRAAD